MANAARASTVKKSPSARQGHPMLSGILIGLVLGVSLSAGVAVWVARMPNPFQNRAADGGPGASPVVTPAPAPVPAPPAPRTEANVGTGTPATAAASEHANPAGSASDAASPAATAAGASAGASPAGAPPAGAAKSNDTGMAMVQVGAFSSEEDALRQVETIAQVTGSRARVQPPDKTADHPLYRVRIGPLARGQELAELVDALKANGISSTVVRAPAADPPH